MPHAFTFHSCGKCRAPFASCFIVFTFVVCEAWRMRDMREKMRSSNGRERPKIQQNAEFAGWIHRTVEFVETSLSRPLKSHKPLQANFLLKDGGNGCVEFEERLRHSLLDLGRRLQNSGDEDTVDFVMFRLRHINRHLLHFERYTEVVRSISAVIVLLESEEERAST